MPPDGPKRGRREVYVELVRIGNTIKATAIDPDTGREAIIIGAAGSPPADLQRLAVRKLEKLLADKDELNKKGDASPRRPGIIV